MREALEGIIPLQGFFHARQLKMCIRDSVWTQGRSCWKKAGDGKFDELQTLMQQAREATGNEQQELWNKCFDLLAEEVPLYPLFHRELATGYQLSLIHI